jgi:hypothetical protein
MRIIEDLNSVFRVCFLSLAAESRLQKILRFIFLILIEIVFYPNYRSVSSGGAECPVEKKNFLIIEAAAERKNPSLSLQHRILPLRLEILPPRLKYRTKIPRFRRNISII